MGAQVPIVIACMGYDKKISGLGPIFQPTGDIYADMAANTPFYAPFKGKNADQFHAGLSLNRSPSADFLDWPPTHPGPVSNPKIHQRIA